MPDKPGTLNDYLKQYREDTKGTGHELMQADIALRLRMSQPTISKIERGLTDLSTWEPSRLYDLLIAWRQTPAQMLELADRYDLKQLKPKVVCSNHTGRSTLSGSPHSQWGEFWV